MNKSVTDFFKQQESSLSETLNDLPNVVVNNENPSSSNVEEDKQLLLKVNIHVQQKVTNINRGRL